MKNFDSFLELACARFSVRKFSDRPVEKEKLDRILRTAQAAPTTKNCQPQRIYVLQSKEALETVRTQTSSIYNASTVLLVCCEPAKAILSAEGINSAHVDTAIVTTHMMLAAWDEGIGSCWIRTFRIDDVRKAFGLPENIEPMAIMPIGYAAEDAVPAKGWHDVRKPMDEIVKYL